MSAIIIPSLGPLHLQVLILVLLVGGGVFFVLRRRRTRQREDGDRGTSSEGSPGAPGEGADVTVLGPSAQAVASTSAAAVAPEHSPRAEGAATGPSGRTRGVTFGDGERDGWAVETHGLTKRFDTTVAVDDVELLVSRVPPSAISARMVRERQP